MRGHDSESSMEWPRHSRAGLRRPGHLLGLASGSGTPRRACATRACLDRYARRPGTLRPLVGFRHERHGLLRTARSRPRPLLTPGCGIVASCLAVPRGGLMPSAPPHSSAGGAARASGALIPTNDERRTSKGRNRPSALGFRPCRVTRHSAGQWTGHASPGGWSPGLQRRGYVLRGRGRWTGHPHCQGGHGGAGSRTGQHGGYA